MRDAGPDRMESAGKIGIPQIISACSINNMSPAKSRSTSEVRSGQIPHMAASLSG